MALHVGSASASAGATNGGDHITSWTERFAQAVDCCDSVIPVTISTAFGAIHTRIDNALGRECRARLGQDSVNFYDAVFDQLSVTICTYWLWPWFIPNAEYLVEKTLKDMGKIARNERTTNCWEYLRPRGTRMDTDTSTTNANGNFEHALRREILFLASIVSENSGSDNGGGTKNTGNDSGSNTVSENSGNDSGGSSGSDDRDEWWERWR